MAPGGAGGQAVAQTVAVMLAHELRLAVHHVYCALVAGLGAQAAAGAFSSSMCIIFLIIVVSSLIIHTVFLDFLG
jgi:hypothetical protein